MLALSLWPMIALWAGLLIVWMVLALVVFRRRNAPIGSVPGAGRPDEHPFDPADSAGIVGGAWVNGVSVSWPYAELQLDRAHALIRARRLRVFKDVSIDRPDVLGVELRRGPGAGIRFKTEDGRFDRVTFWGLRRGQVVEILRRFEWPILPARPPV